MMVFCLSLHFSSLLSGVFCRTVLHERKLFLEDLVSVLIIK